MQPVRIFEAVLIMMLSLFVSSSRAEEPIDPSEVLQPGEQDFDRGHGGSKGNEDSDALDEVAQMGAPTYAGTGCPRGSVTSILSSDARTLAIIFDSFAVQAGDGVGLRNQLNCQMRIPVTVPAGYKLQATAIDYRGFAHAPDKRSRAVLQSRYEIFGSGERKKRRGNGSCHKPERGSRKQSRGCHSDNRGNRDNDNIRERFSQPRTLGKKVLRRSVFKGPYSDSYLVSSRIPAGGQSDCGEDVTLIITNVATAVSKSGAETLMTVDTIDSSTETVRYHLRWKRCN